MIVYLAVPFAFGDLGSINSAKQKILKNSAILSKEMAGSVVVNPIFTVYNSDQKTKLFSEKEFYMHAKVLMDAADKVIVMVTPNWDYSEVTANELGYAYHTNKDVLFVEPPNDKIVHSDNKDSPTN